MRVYTGELTPDQALAVVDSNNPRRRDIQVCELNFYSGQLSLLQGNRDEGIRRLQLAANECPRSEFERVEARAELRGLGVQP